MKISLGFGARGGDAQARHEAGPPPPTHRRGSPKLARIVRLYHRRLRSMPAGALREKLSVPEASELAEGIAAMIDGLYLRRALAGNVALASPDTPAERARSLRLAKQYVAAVLNLEGRL
jgi:hypothetical protein